MNLASAIYGAMAVAVATLVAAEVAASTIAGIAAGLFLAFSHTFWSQAITAEVYTLHLLMVGGSLLALFAWERHPTLPRLALFYTIYALGFGNHLSMVLLLPGFALFLLTQRRHAGDPLEPRTVLMALAIAALGALQYAWNFRGLWTLPEPPSSLVQGIGQFWFDVTKADWRETLVMGVSETGLQTRPSMYWWDLRQQLGAPGVALAIIGFAYLVARWPRRAALLAVLFVTSLMFAWTYNVGDAYIFFLPSHYILTLCAGAGVAGLMYLARLFPLPSSLSPTIGLFCLLYPAWRGYDTLPAIDRSWDTRAVQIFDRLTACDNTAFGLDANWQVQNAAEYYMREHKPATPWFVTEELTWLRPGNPGAFRRLAATNSIVITGDTLHKILAVDPTASFLTRVNLERPLVDYISALDKGLVYALAVLRPYREFPIDRDEVESAWKVLAGDAALPPLDDYTIIVGQIGEPPHLIRSNRRPFRAKTALGGLDLDLRMESWLPTDTIRRSGFGHVVANRHHLLALDRGLSLVVLGAAATPVLTAYRYGLFAPMERWVSGLGDTLPPSCYR